MSERSPDPFGFSVLRRRRFLQFGLGAVALAGGGYAALRFVGGPVPHVAGLHVLGDRHKKTVDAIFRTLYPTDVGVVGAVEQVGLTAHLDRFMHEALHPDVASQLKLAITYVELAPVVLEARLHTFSELSQQQQQAHWRRHWELTDDDLRRALGAAFRRLSALWCYDNDTLWPHIHYPGPILVPFVGQ